jgi:hypothetical protein
MNFRNRKCDIQSIGFKSAPNLRVDHCFFVSVRKPSDGHLSSGVR